MAVSFSAEYLYQGTKFLSRAPMTGIEVQQNGFQCPEAVYIVARAVYALGVGVIAPIGILYHEVAKGICYAQTFLPGRNIVELERLMTEYNNAISYDYEAWITSLTDVVFTVLVVVGVYSRAYAALAIPALALLLALLARIPIGNLFLTYNYATQPGSFINYLPGAERESYGAYYLYNGLVRAGIAIDQPLTPEEIQQLDQFRRHFGNNNQSCPHQYAFEIYHFLLRRHKIMPAWQAHSQAFLQCDIPRVWREAHNEGELLGGTNEEKRARSVAIYSQRVQPILAALPPVGAPAPAAAARA